VSDITCISSIYLVHLQEACTFCQLPPNMWQTVRDNWKHYRCWVTERYFYNFLYLRRFKIN